MRSYYQSRLGISLDEIRQEASRWKEFSYAQVERKLFIEKYGREPLIWDEIKWWWNGREERKQQRLQADKSSLAW